MKYFQMLFSPTGGTAKVAGEITRHWQDTQTIDLSVPHLASEFCSFSSDDVILIAFPSFGGLAPQVALDRLKKFHGNNAKCILVCVYGNRAYEDTLVQMEDTATDAGFTVIAAIAAIAEHSIMHQYAAGRPDKNDCLQLEEFSHKISEKLLSGNMSSPDIPGGRPYKKGKGISLVPKADSSCNSCNLCIAQCPVQAIDAQNPKITDSKTCISCMRCIAVCPAHARKINKAMVSVAALAMKKVCSGRKKNELFI